LPTRSKASSIERTPTREAVADEVFALLSLEYFRLKVPAIYFIAEAGGFLLESIELGRIPKTAIDGVESTVRQFGQFLENPIDKVVALAKAVRDFPFETDADARRAADVVFTAIALLPLMFGLKSTQSQYGWDAEPDSTAPQGDSLAERALAFRGVRLRCDAHHAGVCLAPCQRNTAVLECCSRSAGRSNRPGRSRESWDAKLKIDAGTARCVPASRLETRLRRQRHQRPERASGGQLIVRRADKLDPPTLALNDGVGSNSAPS
jgi:hypothetical protein